MQALQMKFNTKEDAIAFADKQGRWTKKNGPGNNPTSGISGFGMHQMACKIAEKLIHHLSFYCVLIGWDFTVQEPNKKIIKKKIYADNFKYSPKKLRFVKTK